MIRKTLLVILLVSPSMATAIVTKLNAQPRRFAEVVPGKIYRGGRPTADQITSLHREKNIRAIVSLLEEKSTPEEKARMKAARECRIQVLRFPMRGDGTSEFDVLDRAADAINDENYQPLFFHCAAGKQRSNAVQAAWRMKHCGWTLVDALRELEEKHGLEPDGDESKLVDHITAYAAWLEASNGRGAAMPATSPRRPM